MKDEPVTTDHLSERNVHFKQGYTTHSPTDMYISCTLVLHEFIVTSSTSSCSALFCTFTLQLGSEEVHLR